MPVQSRAREREIGCHAVANQYPELCSVGDAVVASILLYSCRHCERQVRGLPVCLCVPSVLTGFAQLGSSKYFMHIVFAFLLTAALELGALVTLPLRSALTTGPYGIVCASLALYYGAPAAADRHMHRALVVDARGWAQRGCHPRCSTWLRGWT